MTQATAGGKHVARHVHLKHMRTLVAGWGLAEAAVALLLASALLFPVAVGGKAWPPALAIVVLAAVWKIARERRLGPVPIVMLVYLAVYVVAALHGGAISGSDFARYFLRPVMGLTVATLVVTATQRRHALGLVALFVAVQIPVTAGQAFGNIVQYGRRATVAVDSVTGTLGPHQTGVLALCALAVAAIVVSMWLSGALRKGHAVLAAAGLLSVCVFASTRASIAFVPAVSVGIVAIAGTLGALRPPVRRVVGLLVATVFAMGALYGSIRALYPEAFVGAVSSQRLTALGGAAAQGIATKPGAKPPRVHGVLLLPGRFVQLEDAVRASVDDGTTVVLIGRGFGSSQLNPRYRLAQDVPLPERTGPTWIGRILTETGWLGLCAFFGLLIWLALLGRRICQRAAPGTLDRALGASLPGIAALTAIGGAYNTILDVRGYSAIFWILVGVAISAASEVGIYRGIDLSRDVSP